MEIAVLNNLDIIVENPIVGNLIVLSVLLEVHGVVCGCCFSDGRRSE